MQIFLYIKRTIFFIFLFSASSLAFAVPITFEFTGTVSNQILSNGRLIKANSKVPQWHGKGVSGQMMIDIEGLATNPNQVSYQSYYQSGYEGNGTDWLSFSLTNPDGSTHQIPGGYDPFPEVDVNGSVAYLTNPPAINDMQFYAGRTYSNLRLYPHQNISLRLSGRSQLISGQDFHTVEINPQFAYRENYGLVDYAHENGTRFEYYFTIDSIKRVPEPSSWVLMLCGLSGLLWARRRRAQQIK